MWENWSVLGKKKQPMLLSEVLCVSSGEKPDSVFLDIGELDVCILFVGTCQHIPTH